MIKTAVAASSLLLGRTVALLALPWCTATGQSVAEAPQSVPETEVDPEAESAAPTPVGPLRRVPESWIREGEERRLEQLQVEFSREILRAELDALKLEASLTESRWHDPERAQRIADDRESLSTLVETSFVNSRNPSPNSPWSLSLSDRFLFGFAVDHLRREGASVELLEGWYHVNQRFLESSDRRDRDLAIEKRDEALASREKAALLRQILAALQQGPLTREQKQTFLGLLQESYPDEPLPALQFGSGPDGGEEGSLGVSGAGPSTDLPRLDGAEHPLAPLSSLRDLLPSEDS